MTCSAMTYDKTEAAAMLSPRKEASDWFARQDRHGLDDIFPPLDAMGENDLRVSAWAKRLWGELFDEAVFAADTDLLWSESPLVYEDPRTPSSDYIQRLRQMLELPVLIPDATRGHMVFQNAARDPQVADYIRSSLRLQLWLYLSLLIHHDSWFDITDLSIWNVEGWRPSGYWAGEASSSTHRWGRAWRVLRAIGLSYEQGVTDACDMVGWLVWGTGTKTLRSVAEGNVRVWNNFGTMLLSSAAACVLYYAPTADELWEPFERPGQGDDLFVDVWGKCGDIMTLRAGSDQDTRPTSLVSEMVQDAARCQTVTVYIEEFDATEFRVFYVGMRTLTSAFFSKDDPRVRRQLIHSARVQLEAACREYDAQTHTGGDTPVTRYMAPPPGST